MFRTNPGKSLWVVRWGEGKGVLLSPTVMKNPCGATTLAVSYALVIRHTPTEGGDIYRGDAVEVATTRAKETDRNDVTTTYLDESAQNTRHTQSHHVYPK